MPRWKTDATKIQFMRRLNMPPQIVRLVLLTIGIVAAYLVARYILTPSSFGQYGFIAGTRWRKLRRAARSMPERNPAMNATPGAATACEIRA